MRVPFYFEFFAGFVTGTFRQHLCMQCERRL